MRQSLAHASPGVARTPPAACRSCGSAELTFVGEIPLADSFAGRVLTEACDVSGLWACGECFLRFRHPCPTDDELGVLYQAGTGDAWATPSETRRDWQIAARWLEALPAADVLDVGCFDGGFLRLLPERLGRFGVETLPEAAAVATSHGVDVVAGAYGELVGDPRMFDVVTAFDVIEHVNDPGQFVRTLFEHIRPGGSLIISTGNTDARTWRYMGAAYWYCWLAEHISFVNPRWCRRVAEREHLVLARIEPFAHGVTNRSVFAGDLAKNMLYRTARRAVTAARLAQMRRAGGDVRPAIASSPPAWMSARDHLIVEFSRPAVSP